MKSMKNPKTSLVIASLLAVVVASTVAGCGPGAPPAVGQASQTQVDNAVKMRATFVKANGNYDSLSAEDKEAYIKLAGSEAAGQAQWKEMSKNPASAVGGGTTFTEGDPRAKMGGAPGAGG